MSWDGVVLDGLVGNVVGSALGGLIAAGVAYKTVRWTQRSADATAAAAVAARATESMLRATTSTGRLALQALRAHDGVDPAVILHDWEVERAIQRPFLEGTHVWTPLEWFQMAVYRSLEDDARAFREEKYELQVAGNVVMDEFGEWDVPLASQHTEWSAAAQDAISAALAQAEVSLQQLRVGRSTPVDPSARVRVPRLVANGHWAREHDPQ